MDVIDLWEVLTNAGDWSFETFPWDVFSLCQSTVQSDSTILSPDEDNESHLLHRSASPSNCEAASGKSAPTICQNQFQSENVPSQQSLQAEHSTDIFKPSTTEPKDNVYENDLGSLPSTSIAQDTENPGLSKEKDVKDSAGESQTLEQSMLSLKASFEDKSELGAFEKLSKRKEDRTMDVAKLLENTPKNRYKDVLPYDDSRVILQEYKSGDYINASFVSMEIPPLQKINEYIATQGPLPQTCDEFWQMIWEQKCNIIVMVTTLKERNRVKCHKYWPDLNETITYSDVQISCFEETETPAGITRDLLLNNEEKDEQRHVIQLQHITWPDHGVPEDATDFLNFIQQLRELRAIVGGKVVVHCSAGVGRTGVLILMETAMCLMETENPIIPLDLIRIMRDQRVMMVQTVGQYKFICEALLKLYNDYQTKGAELPKSPQK